MSTDSGFTLHGIALSGPTYRVALMLSLSSQPFAYRHVDMMRGAHRSPGYRALNRFGQVPVLEHAGLRLCQSHAILEYLAETLGKFGAGDVATRQRLREWLFWDADRLSPPIYRVRAGIAGFLKQPIAVLQNGRDQAMAGLGVLEAHLVGERFLVAGRPTIADISCYAAAAYGRQAGLPMADFPAVAAWMDRIADLPGFRSIRECLPMHDREAA